jgi:Trk K+ transport system NAD-binding subunit
MTAQAALEAANCQDASLIILTSGNDAYNLEAGLKALRLNPNAQIWIRLYRSGLASLIGTKDNVHFFSPYERAAEALMEQIAEPTRQEHGAGS